MSDNFEESVEEVLSTEGRYTPEAYHFLRQALEFCLKRRRKGRTEQSSHVSASELLDGFRLLALQEFGPMAITVLEYWGLRSCEDVGNMVWALVEAGAFGKTEEDRLEDFRRGFEFEEAFVRPFRAQPSILSEKGTRTVESPQ